MDLLIASNPDPDSRLGYLLRLPIEGGLVFRTSGTWPRTKALYCYPVSTDEWPDNPDIVERAPLRTCRRRGAAIDVVLDRHRENRSQLVFTTARGRDAVFWQSPRTRKQVRPKVRTPTARASGIADMEIVVDGRERYPYRFSTQQVNVVKRSLPCGDYGLIADERLVAAVERKSLGDLVTSLINATLRYALGELARPGRRQRDKQRPGRRPPKSARGRWTRDFPCPTGAGCGPTCGRLGATHTSSDVDSGANGTQTWESPSDDVMGSIVTA